MKRAIGMLMTARTAPFLPTQISGLKLWLKADSLSLADNDPVTTWADQSGIGNTVTAAATEEPLYKTNIQNGLPIVRFDGSNDVMSKAGFSGIDGIAGMSIFIVAKETALQTSKYLMSKWDYPTDGTFGLSTFTASDEFVILITDSPTDAGNNYSESNNADLTTTFYLLEIVYDGSLSASNRVKMYKNGTLLSNSITGTIVTSLVISAAPFRLGSILPTFNYNGDMGEVIIYNSALSDGNRANVESYLLLKWGL